MPQYDSKLLTRCLHVQFQHQSSRFIIQVCTGYLFYCIILPTKYWSFYFDQSYLQKL
uniref:Uncharacterized protein n=1 Tax=Arundo donax TaxID=35708 RepID=A0A0A9FZ33_ARUDO